VYNFRQDCTCPEWEAPLLTAFGFEISLENCLTFAGLVFVALQMRESTQQLKRQSQIHIYDINRDLISLGFSHPKLFEILKDAPDADHTLERRYLQLWLNQLYLIDSFKKSGAVTKDFRESTARDLRDMMLMKNMRRQWQQFGKYYPASFQESVNDILKEAGYAPSVEPGKEPTP
jgi:hypothetical protein